MRTLLHSHTRTCFGAAFCTAMPSTLLKPTTGTAGSSSRVKESNGKMGSAIDSDADYEDSKTAHKRNLDFSDDKDDKQYESKVEPSSGQCLTWSNDCSIRCGLHILKTFLHSCHVHTGIALHSHTVLLPPLKSFASIYFIRADRGTFLLMVCAPILLIRSLFPTFLCSAAH